MKDKNSKNKKRLSDGGLILIGALVGFVAIIAGFLAYNGILQAFVLFLRSCG